MLEHITPILLATAQAGQTITKNTSVSILLVVMLLGSAVTVTNIFNTVSHDIDNLKADVAEIREHQNTIIDYIKATNISLNSSISDVVVQALSNYEFEIIE